MKYRLIESTHSQNTQCLVLCSDLIGSETFWEPQIQFFRQFFHVFIYDQEGSYLDLASPMLKPDHSVADMAQQLYRLIKHAGIPAFHFVGLGLGGLIGMELANRVLESQEKILSLTLINSWSKLDPHTEKCLKTRISLLEKVGIQAFVEAQSLLLYPPAWISKNSEMLKQEELKHIEAFPAVHNVLTRLNAMMKYVLDAQTIEVVKQIPTHIIVNKHDFLVPYQQSKILKQQLPHATLTELTSGGHASIVTDADLMNQAILARLVVKKLDAVS